MCVCVCVCAYVRVCVQVVALGERKTRIISSETFFPGREKLKRNKNLRFSESDKKVGGDEDVDFFSASIK